MKGSACVDRREEEGKLGDAEQRPCGQVISAGPQAAGRTGESPAVRGARTHGRSPP